MNNLAGRYTDRGIGFYFLYTREAHPGENAPAIRSMEQKAAHAKMLKAHYQVTRPIVLDSLDGACHRAYGLQPNMTWIFNKAGIPIYKCDWTDSHSVENALVYFLDVAERRRNRERMAPFRVERLDYRNHDRQQFMVGLEAAGPKAVQEYRDAQEKGLL